MLPAAKAVTVGRLLDGSQLLLFFFRQGDEEAVSTAIFADGTLKEKLFARL